MPAPGASETVYGHVWAVRLSSNDGRGLLFMSQYYDERPEVPAEAMTGDQRTMAYVQKAIAYYDRNGLDATVEFYRSEASAEDGRSLTLLDAEESVVLVYRTISALEGQYVGPGLDLLRPWGADRRRHGGRLLGYGPGHQPSHQAGRAPAIPCRPSRRTGVRLRPFGPGEGRGGFHQGVRKQGHRQIRKGRPQGHHLPLQQPGQSGRAVSTCS